MLTGEKVTLRAIRPEDIKPWYQLMDTYVDQGIYGGGSWVPCSEARFAKYIERGLNDPEPGRFLIEANHQIIGDCGLYYQNRQGGTTCFGIAIFPPEYLGKGYGRDAVRLLCYYTFIIQNFRRMYLSTTSNNERAIRAYQACGFMIEGRLRRHVYFNGDYIDDVHMGLLRHEWEALNFPPPILGKRRETEV